jgi:hypothetical protein
MYQNNAAKIATITTICMAIFRIRFVELWGLAGDWESDMTLRNSL